MKLFVISLFILCLLSPGLASCSDDDPKLPLQGEQPAKPDSPPVSSEPGKDDEGSGNNTDDAVNGKLNIRIGTTLFTVTLEENATVKDFRALLPLTLNMSELNGNEKFYNLSTNLPTAAIRPGTIRTGDLMLYGSNCLVLFYETFSSPYSYTRIGCVDNPSGLVAALGFGSINVIFE